MRYDRGAINVAVAVHIQRRVYGPAGPTAAARERNLQAAANECERNIFIEVFTHYYCFRDSYDF